MGAEEPGNTVSIYTNAAGKLTIDPDRVEVFLDYMNQALIKLWQAERQSERLMYVDPPGDDPFSPSAAEAIKRAAGEEPGGHMYANRQAQRTFQSIIENTRASLAAYREREARSAEVFRGEK